VSFLPVCHAGHYSISLCFCACYKHSLAISISNHKPPFLSNMSLSQLGVKISFQLPLKLRTPLFKSEVHWVGVCPSPVGHLPSPVPNYLGQFSATITCYCNCHLANLALQPRGGRSVPEDIGGRLFCVLNRENRRLGVSMKEANMFLAEGE